jgi:hypothetical protein
MVDGCFSRWFGSGTFYVETKGSRSVTPVAKARLQEELCPGCLHRAAQNCNQRQPDKALASPIGARDRSSTVPARSSNALHREPAGHARPARRLQPLCCLPSG